MTTLVPRLLLQAPPFLRRGITTPGLMREVIIALGPVIVAAVWYFGLSALLVIAAATAGAMATEWLCHPGKARGASLGDGSAALTGIILGLTLPPSFPMWMAFVGGAAGIGLGKLVFGGLGQNMFNPALVGRAFLQAAFPSAITTWSAPAGGELLSVHSSNFALPLMQGTVDAVATATPLATMKFEHQATDFWTLMIGNTSGSLGETCGLVILICGAIMILRRTCDWRIPVSILVTVGAASAIVWMFDSQKFPPPLFMIGSGGLLFGAVYMATDPVTSPLTPRGAVIFGVGVGVLVVLIRIWGGLPEGVMYAILLMNAATPLIEKIGSPTPLGRGRVRA